jgi:hypothetical protein
MELTVWVMAMMTSEKRMSSDDYGARLKLDMMKRKKSAAVEEDDGD